MNAVARQEGSVIGRLKTGLSLRTAQSGDWYDRLLSAPLSGGARYNGPSATLFSLAGLADQRLTGPLGVAVERPPLPAGVLHSESRKCLR